MKVVVDTNVFVSGIFWKGQPFQILRLWQQAKFRMVVLSAILEEYGRVLADLSERYSLTEYGRIIELVKLNAEFVEPVRFNRAVCRDKDDDKFLEAGVAARAQFVVSGDRDLLELEEFHGISILTPKVFLGRI